MGRPGTYRIERKVASDPSGMHRSGVMFGLGISLPTQRNSEIFVSDEDLLHPVIATMLIAANKNNNGFFITKEIYLR